MEVKQSWTVQKIQGLVCICMSISLVSADQRESGQRWKYFKVMRPHHIVTKNKVNTVQWYGELCCKTGSSRYCTITKLKHNFSSICGVVGKVQNKSF